MHTVVLSVVETLMVAMACRGRWRGRKNAQGERSRPCNVPGTVLSATANDWAPTSTSEGPPDRASRTNAVRLAYSLVFFSFDVDMGIVGDRIGGQVTVLKDKCKLDMHGVPGSVAGQHRRALRLCTPAIPG